MQKGDQRVSSNSQPNLLRAPCFNTHEQQDGPKEVKSQSLPLSWLLRAVESKAECKVANGFLITESLGQTWRMKFEVVCLRRNCLNWTCSVVDTKAAPSEEDTVELPYSEYLKPQEEFENVFQTNVSSLRMKVLY